MSSIDSLNVNYLSELPVFKPDATKALVYSAIFPGLGQIYNRKYWKLPLVYGGFLGCVYAISWNSSQYNGYKQAYGDFVNNTGDSWYPYIPLYLQDSDPSTWDSSTKSRFTNTLKLHRDYHRRNRDLSYIVTVAMYALCMIDAYVDAQLFDFDVSDNLAIKIQPAIFEKTQRNAAAIGFNCSFNF
ncbi:hypothetical protein AwDysgo_09070 [Bacteroidales bacterium]|nr:hypothetical protein AwDysgo_09070 [Bacteroidales bacterium]